jgi:hypothetical protein
MAGSLRGWCKAIAVSSLVFGGMLIPLGILFALQGVTEDMIAGAAGLVAGALLFGSGLLSLAVLAASVPKNADHSFPDEF